MALESRLTEVRYELQNMESQLRTYDNLIEYATLVIQVDEVEVYTPATVEPKGDLEKMKDGFVNSLQEIGKDLKNFGIDFVIALPYLFVWAVIITIIVLLVRLLIKSRTNKKKKKDCQKTAGKRYGVGSDAIR